MVKVHPPRQLRLEVDPDFEALADLRQAIRGFLEDIGVGAEVADDLLLVATELCTNAIEASAELVPVEVEVRFDGRSLRLSVSNVGDGPAHEVPELPHGSLQHRGRGLAIVQSLVDTLSIASSDGRTVVRTVQLLGDEVASG